MADPVRTLPRIFPVIQTKEVRPFALWKSSLMRRLAMAQNYLWANLRRVYANHGFEGAGNVQFHVGTSNYQNGADDALGDADPREVIIGASRYLPLVSFYVPPNWCASPRVKVQGRAQLWTSQGPSSQTIAAMVYDLDEHFTGIVSFAGPVITAGAYNWSCEVAVPQDKAYQIKVFSLFTSGNPGGENNDLNERCVVYNVSARYAEANASELKGDTPKTTWTGIHENAAQDNYSISTALLKRLVENTNHLYCHRNPELCQSWLDAPYHNTSTWTEIGRYTFYSPDKCTKIQGQLIINCTHGGVNNNVRILLNGSVITTSADLSTGETEWNFSEYTAVTAGQENTITIEARSTAASADWGTRVWGVSIWESGVDTYLPSGMSAPSAFQPIDEAGIEGDDVVTSQNNLFGQESGLRQLIQNDAYLFRNRLRMLVGDWRHRTYKRGPKFGGSWNKVYDPRVDWTPGARGDYQPYAWKNCTMMGNTASLDNKDAYNKFDATDPYQPTSVTNYTETPYIYPYDITYPQAGRRLGNYRILRPIGMTGHINETAGWECRIRGRRLRVAQLSVDQNGMGPALWESGYKNRHFLDIDYDGTRVEQFILGRGQAIPDHEKHWIVTPTFGQHTNSDKQFQIRGRQSPTVNWSAPTSAYSSNTGGAPVLPKEGLCCETEVCSVYLADQPLNVGLLRAL